MKMRRLLLSLFLLLSLVLTANFVMVSHAQDCPETRLEIGGQGRVTPGAPNRVRGVPSTSGELLGEIPAGSVFDVLDGPECADGFLWWNVDFDGLVGWTVEGNNDGYFVEPVSDAPPTPVTPAPPGDCAMTPLLEIGREGKTTSNTPSRLRDNPGTSANQVGQIDPLDTFNILEGPLCADGINWWRVNASGAVGWTAEGVDGEYLVEMLELVPTATPPYIGLPDAMAVAWSADGARIAVGTSDGVYLFDADSDGEFSTPPTLFLEGSEVEDLAFNPIWIAHLAVKHYTDENYSAAVYNVDTGEKLLSLAPERPTGVVNSLTYNMEGTRVALNSAGFIEVHDIDTSNLIYSFQLNASSSTTVGTMSSDGNLIGVSDGDAVVVVPVGGIRGDAMFFDRETIRDRVLTMAIDPNNENVVVGDAAGNLQMWDILTRERTSFIRGQRSTSSNRVNDLLFNPNNTVIYTAESDPNAVVRTFSAETLATVNALDFGPGTSAAVALALSPDGTQLAVVVDDTVRIIDTETFSQIAQLVLRLN